MLENKNYFKFALFKRQAIPPIANGHFMGFLMMGSELLNYS
jgi:hypothetical protein